MWFLFILYRAFFRFSAIMKRKIAIVVLFSVLGAGSSLFAQNVKFKKYFEDATLRIDYLRTGNRQHDTVGVQKCQKIVGWAGSLTQLLDPFDNGDYRISRYPGRTGSRGCS